MAHVADHLSVSALEEKYRSCTNATAARHVQTIWLLAKGHHIAEVAATVSYARRWVERLLARYNAEGPEALGVKSTWTSTAKSARSPTSGSASAKRPGLSARDCQDFRVGAGLFR